MVVLVGGGVTVVLVRVTMGLVGGGNNSAIGGDRVVPVRRGQIIASLLCRVFI